MRWPGVAVGVRMFQDVEQIATLDVEDDFLESPMPRSARSFAFFASSQSKYFTEVSVAQRVLDRHTLASDPVCPNPTRGVSIGSQRQPSYQSLSYELSPKAEDRRYLETSAASARWSRHPPLRR
jgi:hypothetical protein